MLVLSRTRDEKIMIGDQIEVVVVEVRGDKVRLGIKAPREVPVHRQEVYEAIQRELELQDQQNTEDESSEERMWKEWSESKGKKPR